MNEQFTFGLDQNELELCQLEKTYRSDLNDAQTCPVCHIEQKKYVILADDMLGYSIQCCFCGFVGPYSSDIKTAIMLFNQITCDHNRGF